MLSLISFILVCIGSINWFCIGILQFDFVAGIFGSQSNIFSRLIYTLVGVASLIVIANFITNKGKFVVSFKKANKEYNEYKEEKKEEKKQEGLKRKKAMATEGADEFTIEKEMTDEKTENNKEQLDKVEASEDFANKNTQSELNKDNQSEQN
ncbi:MAG: DUF378 domain-containing protein [Christensenellales bacterium]